MKPASHPSPNSSARSPRTVRKTIDHDTPIDVFLGGRVKVVIGDITTLRVDAIVNAANATLLGGGGVDGAIHEAGGPEIREECRRIRQSLPDGLPVGESVVTCAGKLPAHYVIHTVGPVFADDAADGEMLAACYRNSLETSRRHHVRSVAFPSISTGAFGYPLSKAAPVSSAAIEHYACKNEHPREIVLVFFSERDADIFLEHHRFSHR